MGRTRQRTDSCIQCLEYIMYSLNILYFIIGSVLIGVGIWIIVDKDFMSPLFNNKLMTASEYLIVIGGVGLVIFSFVGCFGTLMQSRGLLLMYFAVIFLMFLILMISGILAAVFRTQIRMEIRMHMMKTISESYGIDPEVTAAWDRAQQTLHCCAVDANGWNLYKDSEWYKQQPSSPNQPLVPPSCCEMSEGKYRDLAICQRTRDRPPGKNSSLRNDYLHYPGCYFAGRDLIWEFSGYLIGLAFGIACSQIGGMVFSMMLYTRLY